MLSSYTFVSRHLVPYKQPLNALDLITWFLKHESFSDFDLPSFDFSQTNLPSPVPRFGMRRFVDFGWWSSLLWMGFAYIWQKKRDDYYDRRLPSDEAGIDEMTGLR